MKSNIKHTQNELARIASYAQIIGQLCELSANQEPLSLEQLEVVFKDIAEVTNNAVTVLHDLYNQTSNTEYSIENTVTTDKQSERQKWSNNPYITFTAILNGKLHEMRALKHKVEQALADGATQHEIIQDFAQIKNSFGLWTAVKDIQTPK